MRTRIIIGAAVAALSAASVVTAVASAGSSDLNAPKRIHVIELPTKATFTDLNSTGLSQGDLFVATNKLVAPSDRSRVVGHEDDTCTLVAVTAAGGRFECTTTAFLGGGSVMAQGPFNVGGSARLAVTGGTGRYRNARGQVIARDLGNDKADLVFTLIP
jgi:allene oxide cyclase